jgi:hypothetical protein
MVVSAAAAAAGWASASVAAWNSWSSRRSAADARDALALAIRPIFSTNLEYADGRLRFYLINQSTFSAANVAAQVLKGGHAVKAVNFPRIEGRVPHILPASLDEFVNFSVPLDLSGVDSSTSLIVFVRYQDERGLRRWEQEIVILFSDGAQSGRAHVELMGSRPSQPRVAPDA